MIKAVDLTKRYAGTPAVDGLSFEVGKGEIVGFLGPNGAGKTTTIRMLTSYLPASSGSVSIAGHDVFSEPIEARRHIGYMPENVPLYDDMRVREYLCFRARLKGISGAKAVRTRVGEVMDLCGLTDVRKKLIANLSKGYRQRVGLADALVHKPDLLILDEPTNGLDPNQIRQVRSLVRELGQHHTILLSTHILSEVEMTCDRVLILDKGKLKASGKPADLASKLRTAGRVTLEVKTDDPAATANLLKDRVQGIRQANHTRLEDGWVRLSLRLEAESDLREEIHNIVSQQGWPLRELARKAASLEDVFVEITHDDH
ncbi:MAG: ABC transporter ATP-binding protein [Verrucomicrobiales bacterium]|nr:ABC transporter ATP-binding protein [Verrucomicrobiales bacterium]